MQRMEFTMFIPDFKQMIRAIITPSPDEDAQCHRHHHLALIYRLSLLLTLFLILVTHSLSLVYVRHHSLFTLRESRSPFSMKSEVFVE